MSRNWKLFSKMNDEVLAVLLLTTLVVTTRSGVWPANWPIKQGVSSLPRLLPLFLRLTHRENFPTLLLQLFFHFSPHLTSPPPSLSLSPPSPLLLLSPPLSSPLFSLSHSLLSINLPLFLFPSPSSVKPLFLSVHPSITTTAFPSSHFDFSTFFVDPHR